MGFDFKCFEDQVDDIIYFDWITDRFDRTKGKVSIGIRYLDEEIINQIRTEVRESKGKKKKNTFYWDDLLYKRKIARASIRDIKTTYMDLSAVTEPKWIPIVPDGKTWNDSVPFDKNVKEFLVRGMTGDVADFIVEAATEVDTFRKKAEAAEFKNLPDGSDSSQNTTSTGNS